MRLSPTWRRLSSGSKPPASVAAPEDLVIYKALAWRDRDRYDIEQLLTLHGDRIDLERVRAFVHEFAQILGAPERIPEFERLLQKILGPAHRRVR